jgi:protein-disulfide isomerase
MRHLPKLTIALFAVCLVAIGAWVSRAQEATFDPTQKAAIEEIVRAYLIEHPEVIKEAIEALQARQEAAKANQQASALTQHKEQLLSDPMSPIAGNALGDVTLVEFFDYKCPYCKRVTPALVDLLEEDKGVRIVFKEFPILGESSVVAARAALAAARQDRYLDFHNALMAHRGDFDLAAIQAIGSDLGLDVAKLEADMNAPEVEQQLKDNHELALALAIRSTPTFIVGEEIVPGAMSIEDMKALIADFRSGS